MTLFFAGTPFKRSLNHFSVTYELSDLLCVSHRVHSQRFIKVHYVITCTVCDGASSLVVLHNIHKTWKLRVYCCIVVLTLNQSYCLIPTALWVLVGGCGSGQSQCLVIGRSLVRFSSSTCWSVFGQDTEPQTAPDVLVGTLHGSNRHLCMHVLITASQFGRKHLINALNVKVLNTRSIHHLLADWIKRIWAHNVLWPYHFKWYMFGFYLRPVQ